MGKIYFRMLFVSCSICISCNSKSDLHYLTGMYILKEETVDYTMHDTVVILSDVKDALIINRHYRYQRIIDGKKINSEYRRVHSTAYFNESTGQIQEAETGTILIFNKNKSTLIYNNSNYFKVK